MGELTAEHRSAKGEDAIIRIDGGFNTKRVIAFLKALLSDAPCKIIRIVDNRKDHTISSVKEEVEEKQDQSELGFLPPVAPE